MYKFKTTLFVLAALVMITPADAQAQSRSGVGVDTGGDTISAQVPEADRIFSSIDIVQALQDEITDCAQLGFFYDQANNKCRQGVPPVVKFAQKHTGTFVDVELAFGQGMPNTSDPKVSSSPDADADVRYGNLDGKDGSVTLLD